MKLFFGIFKQVNHIFGFHENAGWGLRTTTEKNFNEFKILYNFFHPHAPFFNLIYRLISNSVKYELRISELPIKVRQMLESGRYSTFYTSLLNKVVEYDRNMTLSLSKSNLISIFFVILIISTF
jgi:sphingomyelin phosphodiesterase 4